MLSLEDGKEEPVRVEVDTALAHQLVAAVQVGSSGAPSVPQTAPFQLSSCDSHSRPQSADGQLDGHIRAGVVLSDRVECLNLLRDPFKLTPQSGVCDAGVDHRHLQARVAKK